MVANPVICPSRLGQRIVALLMSAIASLSLAASGFETNDFVTQIADGIYLHQGHHAGLEDENRGDSANIGFIVGNKCVAVVDTGGAISTGKKLRAAIRAVTDKPICFVINTHVHFDHVLGNAAFSVDQPEFVGHANLAESMNGNRTFFVEQFSAELGASDESLVIAPTLLVEDEKTLDLGDRQLLLKATAPAHTDADLSVLDLKTNFLWTGDLVFRERMPILDASLKGWLAWLDTNNASVKVIPGHGPAGDSWATSIVQIKTYLTALLDETRKAIAEGMFLEDALESVAQEAAASWQLNDRHARNVSRAYRQLEWE